MSDLVLGVQDLRFRVQDLVFSFQGWKGIAQGKRLDLHYECSAYTLNGPKPERSPCEVHTWTKNSGMGQGMGCS